MTFVDSRETMLEELRKELVGPAPGGKALNTSAPPKFTSRTESYGPWVDSVTGEEVLERDRPTKRYGVGVLYPLRTEPEVDADVTGSGSAPTASEGELASQDGADATEAAVITEEAARELERVQDRKGRMELGGDDLDLSAANDYRPSAMAISFLVTLPAGTALRVRAEGGRYRELRVQVEGSPRSWWVRQPVTIEATFEREALLAEKRSIGPTSRTDKGADGLDLSLSAFTRPRGPEQTLITMSLINRTDAHGGLPDSSCLFQTGFTVHAIGGDGEPLIEAYPEGPAGGMRKRDPEELSFDLLYRDAQTYAVGHGCAAGWPDEISGRAGWVAAECLPWVETPSITPVIERSVGGQLEIPMAVLAGLDSSEGWRELLDDLVDEYSEWIAARRVEAAGLGIYRDTAGKHLDECDVALERMRAGIELLASDPDVLYAFRLANHAVLLQQLRSRQTSRPTVLDGPSGRFEVTEPLSVPDWRTATARGKWRPFQIAFLLATLPSIADGAHPERDTVELVFFPTGGGKTEAYLGQAAFALFLRRLKDGNDSGVEVLMRYTLRLLTAQQFQRASALICAMEHLRRRDDRLADTRGFSIAIWVGNEATPGDRARATAALRKLNSDKDADNPFLLLRCPWCSSQLGPVEVRGKARRNAPKVAGYVEVDRTVRFQCPDRDCEFRSGVPVVVIDQEIYESPPSMIIGTVDKFAMLAWRPEARSIFGIGPMGTRVTSPPGMIIQDELHLIAGPLGSVVGLYEAVIEELCTDRRHEHPVRPKIISSTATIRRYEDQIKGLYARKDVALFPPRGLDAGDSFFARYARKPDGSLEHGRIYVGIHGAGMGSVQTAQVRTFSALLQGAENLPEDERDPWWTLLIFFNSLRELGTSLSLLQSDIPDYLLTLRNRYGTASKDVRYLRHIKELTSRLRNDEIPQAIDDLSIESGKSNAVDVCLASNIIEVGIDIERLSVMSVVGQPKTTSQYIQVTGRVGRKWAERPGLVATILSPSKPRDRSHFEKFRSYHQRLYAQVEPTSVTPFAPPVVDRALHAALCVYVRQLGVQDLPPCPVPEELISEAFDLFLQRAQDVDDRELGYLNEAFGQRLIEWRGWERTEWSARPSDNSDDIPLLRRAGEWVPPAAARLSWATPTSMRNVDAECIAEVTLRYAQEEGAADE